MAKPRMSKEEKALQAKVDEIVKDAIQNVQIGIFDLGKIPAEGLRAGREAIAEGKQGTPLYHSIREAVTAIVAKLKCN